MGPTIHSMLPCYDTHGSLSELHFEVAPPKADFCHALRVIWRWGERCAVTITDLQDLSWNLAVLCGWLSIILLAVAWHASRKLRASLKAPLTERAEEITHLWERRETRWHRIGLGMSLFSILCFVSWLLCGLNL
jgi:hypothetical protein